MLVTKYISIMQSSLWRVDTGNQVVKNNGNNFDPITHGLWPSSYTNSHLIILYDRAHDRDQKDVVVTVMTLEPKNHDTDKKLANVFSDVSKMAAVHQL